MPLPCTTRSKQVCALPPGPVLFSFLDLLDLDFRPGMRGGASCIFFADVVCVDLSSLGKTNYVTDC